MFIEKINFFDDFLCACERERESENTRYVLELFSTLRRLHTISSQSTHSRGAINKKIMSFRDCLPIHQVVQAYSIHKSRSIATT